MKNTYLITDLVNVDFSYEYLDDVIKKVLKHEHVKNAYFGISLPVNEHNVCQ